MTSQPGWQIILIHLLSNISRSKGNQTMKFGQLIECIILGESPTLSHVPGKLFSVNGTAILSDLQHFNKK